LGDEGFKVATFFAKVLPVRLEEWNNENLTPALEITKDFFLNQIFNMEIGDCASMPAFWAIWETVALFNFKAAA